MRAAWLSGLALVVSTTVALAEQTLSYRLTPQIGKAGHEFIDITLSFQGDADGETILKLPDSWGGKKELYRGISEIRVSGDGAVMRDGTSAAERIVGHAPNAQLTVSYRLEQIIPGPPTFENSPGNPYAPLIQPSYFHLIGHAFLVHPSVSDEIEVDLSFAIDGLRQDWTLAANFAPYGLPFSGRMRFEDFLETIIVAGDFRLSKHDAEGGPVTIAIRGNWSFTDAEFASLVTRIMASARRLFGDKDAAPFLITLLGRDAKPGTISMGGTGLSNAFASFATTGAKLENFYFLLSHEYLHHWIPPQLARLPDGEEQPRYYWFSEGLTDYYTRIVQLQAGLISYAELVKQTNDVLDELDGSPWRREPMDKVGAAFWTDQAAQRIPYTRGHVFSFHVDAAVRRATNSRATLEDVLMDMRKRAGANEPAKVMRPDEALIAAVKTVAGIDIAPAIRDFIDAGNPLKPETVWLGSCVETFVQQRFESDYWFDLDASTASKRVVGVKADSPAAEAGLKDGQIFAGISHSTYGGRPVGPIGVKVKDATGTRQIWFSPLRATGDAITRFRVKPNLTEAEARSCSAYWNATRKNLDERRPISAN
jgi:predicted metalloprotease with PDZ domain